MNPRVQEYRIQGYMDTGAQGYRNKEIQEYRDTRDGMHGYRGAEVQGYRDTEVQG